MPNRIIRDSILTSERVASLGWAEEVFYRRLMSIVDDYGRHEASPQLLRARCYPLQTDLVRVADITRWMAACQKSGLILDYVVDGKRYLEIVRFQQQQRSPSKCPAPIANDSKCEQVLADAHLGVVVVEGVSVVGGVVEGAQARPPRAPLMEPTEEHRNLAAELQVSCQAEFDKYRDWLAANGKRQRDESAGFRNWLRRAAEFKRPGKAASVHDKRAATAAAMFGKQDQLSGEPNDITAESQRVA